MDEEIHIFVKMKDFFNAFHVMSVVFRLKHVCYGHYRTSQRVTHDKPAIRIWFWVFFYLCEGRPALFFRGFLVPTLAIIFSVPSPDNSYIFLMFTWKYAAM